MKRLRIVAEKRERRKNFRSTRANMYNGSSPSLEDSPGALSLNKAVRYIVGAIVMQYGRPAPRVLLIKRAAHEQAFADTWEYPGGSMEQSDDTVYAAVKRELMEETGLRITRVVAQLPDMPLGRYKQNRQLNYVVEVESDAAVKVDPKEHSAFMWVKDGDAGVLNMTDEKRKILWYAFDFAESLRAEGGNGRREVTAEDGAMSDRETSHLLRSPLVPAEAVDSSAELVDSQEPRSVKRRCLHLPLRPIAPVP